MGTTVHCRCAGGTRIHTCQACLGVGDRDPAQLWLPAASRLEKGVEAGRGHDCVLLFSSLSWGPAPISIYRSGAFGNVFTERHCDWFLQPVPC
ncbi:TPA: hypothetical protein BOS_141 [Bos taurus]|nr:TPA: hypothetical protein BOS_141 [Bos taurus]